MNERLHAYDMTGRCWTLVYHLRKKL